MQAPVITAYIPFTQDEACGCHDDFFSAVLVNNPGENCQHFLQSGTEAFFFDPDENNRALSPLAKILKKLGSSKGTILF